MEFQLKRFNLRMITKSHKPCQNLIHPVLWYLEWTRVTQPWIDFTLKGGANVIYSEENNGLAISVTVTSHGCQSSADYDSGVWTFIKGYWAKIKYTQEFRGVSSCWSIFGDNW